MRELLKQDDKEVVKATGVLAYIWRYWLYADGLTGPMWVARLMQHTAKIEKENPGVKISDYKGNLLKALQGLNLPFQRLCQGMSVVSPSGFNFLFKCKVGEKQFDFDIKIEDTYKQERGIILKDIWNELYIAWGDNLKKELTKDNPDLKVNIDAEFKKACKVYSKKIEEKKGKKISSFTNNLKAAISKNHLTFNSFSTCIAVIGIKTYDIGLKCGKTDVTVTFNPSN